MTGEVVRVVQPASKVGVTPYAQRYVMGCVPLIPAVSKITGIVSIEVAPARLGTVGGPVGGLIFGKFPSTK
jgi:hypothetical protein